ncbi:MAG: amidophosphoribosyltransferase [archaeon]
MPADMDLRCECGVGGIYLKKGFNPRELPDLNRMMLVALQHRGQLSAGFTIYDPEYSGRLKIRKEIGRVGDLFKIHVKERNRGIVRNSEGVASLNHVRYATSGADERSYEELMEEALPLLRDHPNPWKKFSIVYNGTLANQDALLKEIKQRYLFHPEVDTAVIRESISRGLNQLSNPSGEKPDFFNVSRGVMERLDGGYAVGLLFADGDMAVWRDPLGIRPMVYGENKDYFAFASESSVLRKIGISRDEIFSVEPGSCLLYNGEGLQAKQLFPENSKRALCHFELVYFAKARSIIDGISVNSVRENLGGYLADNEPLLDKIREAPDDWIVVPVPRTSIPATEEYAFKRGIRFKEAIEVDEVLRGFINRAKDREMIMGDKYDAIEERVRGKHVIVIDDSLVRGSTSRKIVRMIRGAGALSLHMRSTEPPITSPCFYGIDTPTYDELLAANFAIKRGVDLNEVSKRFEKDAAFKRDLEAYVAEAIGADSMGYPTVSGLVKAIGWREEDLCLACVTNNYPTVAGQKNASLLLA